jgi:hypothetical protein
MINAITEQRLYNGGCEPILYTVADRSVSYSYPRCQVEDVGGANVATLREYRFISGP